MKKSTSSGHDPTTLGPRIPHFSSSTVFTRTRHRSLPWVITVHSISLKFFILFQFHKSFRRICSGASYVHLDTHWYFKPLLLVSIDFSYINFFNTGNTSRLQANAICVHTTVEALLSLGKYFTKAHAPHT
jgi:hypothetical protein